MTSYRHPKTGKYTYNNTCRKCASLSRVERSNLDREKYLQYQRTYTKERRGHTRLARKLWLNELKNKPCLDCGQKFHPICMDYDHRDPTKKQMNISYAVIGGYTESSILNEIAKCDLVCSNCHRLRTFLRNESGSRRPKDAPNVAGQYRKKKS